MVDELEEKIGEVNVETGYWPGVEELKKIFKEHDLKSMYWSGEKRGDELIVYAGDWFSRDRIKGKNIPGIRVVLDSEKRKKYDFSPKEVPEERKLEEIFSGNHLSLPDFPNSKICYTYMSERRFVKHSGNSEAVDTINSYFEGFLKGEQHDPICIFGESGSGKSSLLSYFLLKGFDASKLSSYFNLTHLKNDLNANGGARGLDLSYYHGANIFGIDSLEDMPTAKDRKWVRDQVYVPLDRGFSNQAFVLLSYMGDEKDLSKYLQSLPEGPFKNRMLGIEKIGIKYPEKKDHELIIRKTLENSVVAPKDEEKLNEVVSYFLDVIPEGLSFWGIEKGYLQGGIRIAERKKRELEISDIKTSLSFQQNIFELNSVSPQAKFDKIMRKRGYDVESLRKKGKYMKFVKQRDNVIRDLLEDGVTSPSEIGGFINRSHGAVIARLKIMHLY